jgi:uncharacterized protein YprB with RNaseH-like and TPR domain
MLEHTFIHIPGVGPKTEQSLWRRGIINWNAFLERKKVPLSPGKEKIAREVVAASIAHKHDPRFFQKMLPAKEMWRLFEAFRHKAVYLDIETNGGQQGFHEITVIGIFDGRNVNTFVSGKNLSDFEIAISAYDLIITFNGTSFDLPVIRQVFPAISLPPVHIDLRFVLNRLGYRGGLKKIERDVGIQRGPSIQGLDGHDAVSLWNAYDRFGDTVALERLIQYNQADIVNLEPLMELGFIGMKKELFREHSPGF